MSGRNVRISATAYRTLRALAEMDKISIHAALDRVLEEERRKIFLAQANAAFAALKADARDWKEELTERALWARTITDCMEK